MHTNPQQMTFYATNFTPTAVILLYIYTDAMNGICAPESMLLRVTKALTGVSLMSE